MNIMAQLAMENEHFRKHYTRPTKSLEEQINVTLLKEKKENVPPGGIELFMEWMGNQRFPEISEEEDSDDFES